MCRAGARTLNKPPPGWLQKPSRERGQGESTQRRLHKRGTRVFSCSRVFSLLGGGILTGKEEGGGAATMAEVKPEEISHPPMEQLQGFEYCIDSNPPWGA